MSLISTEDTIEVIITDPVFARSTLKEAYGASNVIYNITHWKEGHEKEVGCHVKSVITYITYISLGTKHLEEFEKTVQIWL